ncbi:MAG: ABC transporter substrate-binding protein [Thaumarchaeota archaeon]|nr:ABC transporter substrate-binding protein [Nitrososphaerota archaeon]
MITINETAEFTTNVNQYLPGLALNWTVSADGTTYTLNLRQNVHFSNGDPFNAYQVWAEDYGFYYLSSNSSSWMFGYPVFNMSAVKFGAATLQILNQSGLIQPNAQALAIMQNSSWPIYAPGPYQLVFHLSSAFIYFPGTQVVANGECYDVQFVLQHGGFGTATNVNPNFQETPVPGTGPYIVTSAGPGEGYVTMAQDPSYWAANWTAAQLNVIPIFDPGHVKNIVVNLVTDDLARYTDLASGKVQMADIQSSDWNLVSTNPGYTYYKSPPLFGSIVFLGLGVLTYPTNITAVRRAISHAINFSDISQKAYLGQLVPFVGPEYPTYGQFYNLGNLPPYQYNLTLAKQILANASIDTSKFPVFTMTTLTGCQGCINSAQVIQSDLAQLGITINIQVQTPSQYYTGYGCVCPTLRPQLSMALGGNGYAPNLPTPADAWLSFVNNATINWADYSNPVVQNCVNSFTQSNNLTQIINLCTVAQKQIYNDVPYVWVGVLHPWLPAGGSIVWKTGVIKGFLVDPAFTGAAVGPILNTVTFG